MLTLVLASAQAAESAEPPTLQWSLEEGEVHRYEVQNQVQLSAAFIMESETNEMARVMEWSQTYHLTCSAGREAKRRTAVSCRIDDFAIAARPSVADQRDLQEILDEWDAMLTGATVDMEFHQDGRMLDIELNGLKNQLENERSRLVRQHVRLLVERAMAGLEVPLPPKGRIADDNTWRGRDLRAIAVPSLNGNLGAVSVTAKLGEASGRVASIQVQGKGTRGPNDVVPGTDRQANLWAMEGYGEVKWLVDEGVLLSHELIVKGELTPSSLLANTVTPVPYTQAVVVKRHAAGKELAPLPANRVIE